MPKNKDPAVLFYPSDFLSSTILWSDAEIGMYIKLLCLQFLQDGVSEDDLNTVCGKSKKVRSKFPKCDDGLYRNPRMHEEKIKRLQFATKQRANGIKGGRPKNPNETQAKPKQNPRDNPNESPRDENENVNENINKDTTSDTTFSFSNTTNKQTNKKKTYKEKLTDAELKEYGVFKVKVIHHFADNHFESDPLDFIRYNEERNWIGGYGEDVREHWIVFAEKWELAHVNRQNEIETRKEIKDDG